jgi:FMN phosphatase YigB (HAD superfamily)
MTSAKIRAIVFDQGETLVNETRFWSSVAAYAGVPELTLHGVLGGLIERRESHRSLFNVMQIESVDPNVIGYRIEARDLYPDVIPTIKRLNHEGLALGVAGNQPAGVIEQFAALDLPLTLNASSTLWGVAKPDPAFFGRMADELGMTPAEVMYVGDRIDNDILPAQEIGMHAVFIRRGPWGYLHTAWPEMAQVQHRIDSLAQIPDLVQKLNKG